MLCLSNQTWLYVQKLVQSNNKENNQSAVLLPRSPADSPNKEPVSWEAITRCHKDPVSKMSFQVMTHKERLNKKYTQIVWLC